MNDKREDGIWKIQVKWKGHRKMIWEPISTLKVDQPAVVKKYMQHLKNNKPEKNSKNSKEHNRKDRSNNTTEEKKRNNKDGERK